MQRSVKIDPAFYFYFSSMAESLLHTRQLMKGHLTKYMARMDRGRPLDSTWSRETTALVAASVEEKLSSSLGCIMMALQSQPHPQP